MSVARMELVDYEVVGLPNNFRSLSPIRFSVIEANPQSGKAPFKTECSAWGEAAEKLKKLKLENGSRIELFGNVDLYPSRKADGSIEFKMSLNIKDMTIIGFQKRTPRSVNINDEMPDFQ